MTIDMSLKKKAILFFLENLLFQLATSPQHKYFDLVNTEMFQVKHKRQFLIKTTILLQDIPLL